MIFLSPSLTDEDFSDSVEISSVRLIPAGLMTRTDTVRTSSDMSVDRR